MAFFKYKFDYEELYEIELSKNIELKNECLSLNNQIKELLIEISDLNEKLRKNNNKLKDLESKLKSYNPNLKPIPKKVNFEIKEQVKNMVDNGMTYREISKEIDISIKTISRIINGYYDK